MSFASFGVLVFIKSLRENNGVYVKLQRSGIKIQWLMFVLTKTGLYIKRFEDNFCLEPKKM